MVPRWSVIRKGGVCERGGFVFEHVPDFCSMEGVWIVESAASIKSQCLMIMSISYSCLQRVSTPTSKQGFPCVIVGLLAMSLAWERGGEIFHLPQIRPPPRLGQNLALYQTVQVSGGPPPDW